MSLAYKISAYNRSRKWRRFAREFPPDPTRKILDVGYTGREYSATDNFLEKQYPYPAGITALGIEPSAEFKRRYPAVTAVTYDGHEFPFGEGAFDVCWSNAVLEHVGARSRQLTFLKEIRRTARHGFLTTPNRFFPVEIHTRVPLLHFLPRPWFEWFLKKIGKGWATGDYMRLLSETELRQLLDEAGYAGYRILKNRLLFFTLDFVVVF